jgi:FtsZ-interacting cell division protein ZipA
MPELRWTLLIVGALFIVALALWELRRQRQAPRQNVNPSASSGADRVSPSLESAGEGNSRLQREPTISFPELHPEPRTSAPEPRVVEVDAESFERLPVNGVTGNELLAADDVGSEMSPLGADSVVDNHAYAEEVRAAAREIASTGNTQRLAALDVAASDDLQATAFSAHPVDPEDEETDQLPPLNEGDDSSAASVSARSEEAGASGIHRDEDAHASQSTGFVSDADQPETPVAAQPREPRPVGATAAGAPVVDWPGEEQRRILALRLVSAPAARFQGRAVRQALAAEGFVLGKFDIFHKPGPDDRAVLSAASLTKPGTFTMNTIDAQRFGGISLFAVLPGPLPPQETFDELLITARNLNDRLQGALQDERGEPLTPTRSASIRQSLAPLGHEDSGASAAPSSSATRH